MKIKSGSMMARKCQECERKETCKVKRMEMYWELVPDDCPQLFGHAQMASMPLMQSAAMTACESHTPITINMGEFGTIQTTHEELKRQLQRDIEKQLYGRCLNFGA